ncbi:dienelactone hydrolase [Streptomyces triticagri]|uniref:Dienelactone hydrolase n=1 Tax=Streptomyces triticagri TaxID=2293568 RepID=A0A372M1J2_9ACTN|nr:dienelactone hydrolase family protein [Streptomyces triticagri]RFU84157.1 dienelactone hydrolase [Streptomyces triticagri]
MAEVVLFHHLYGLTDGVREFAGRLRDAGHTVHVPDLYEGRVFDTFDEGLAYAERTGFEVLAARGVAAAESLPAGIVFIGFSLGVLPAQRLAQTRPGAAGAVLLESCLPHTEFGTEWPGGVPVQIHGGQSDPVFAGEGDLAAARSLVAAAPEAELFLYEVDRHLFADPGLPSYDPEAAALVTTRVLAFLDGLPRTVGARP